jgi:50S ribosomal protein L16 3-hydroxylase
MKTNQPLALLGGLTAQEFMSKYWQKKPLLVRNAIAQFKPCISREELMLLAAQDDVESRLILQNGKKWQLTHGPKQAKDFPSLKKKNWTFLVQGVDLHHEGVHSLLREFRFAPDARLDDLMISYATDGGGVGPHFDSYDVFLLQAEGCRRWKIGRQKDLSLVSNLPVKILQNFEPQQEFLLQPGDMLYLPPHYAHDGIAVGECMTWSVGFRAATEAEIGRELLQRMADLAGEFLNEKHYSDQHQQATDQPGKLPSALIGFARQAVKKMLTDSDLTAQVLGEWLTEPKPQVWFDQGRPLNRAKALKTGVKLDRRSKMAYDDKYIYLNGESWRTSGADARLMRNLSDERCLSAAQLQKASQAAIELFSQWNQAGWLKTNF